jgi:23S rRNA (cytosine1962-C5)-methyltransferase
MDGEFCVQLLPGKDRPVLAHHLWIFSGALKSIPRNIPDGTLVCVVSSKGDFLCKAFFNKKSSIIGRVLAYEPIDAKKAISSHIKKAVAFRRALFKDFSGSMCRLVNAEADMLSGLIVDLYDTCAVIQISSLGMDVHSETIISALKEELHLSWVYEKSNSPARAREGLKPFLRTHFGVEQEFVQVSEGPLRFLVSIIEGQKTGFFIDQRENRESVSRLSRSRRVLNCCCYSGAFSIAALKGGAVACTSVDVSQKALDLLEKNLQLNDIDPAVHRSVCSDVFDFLRQNSLEYDLVILDPPAFAKRRQDVDSALSGYREMNRLALEKMPDRSFLLTCSCSYHVDAASFYAMLKVASLEAKRQVKILSQHRHAWDHPTSLTHPETDYLKSALLYVEG